MTNPYLSVVIPAYNEEANLPKLFERLGKALDQLEVTSEIIFTNDGSKDNTFNLLKEFHQQRPHQVRIINFNGNFGQHMAIMAAFEKVRGDVVITLDADLQNPPEEIANLLKAVAAGHDVVGGYRKNRQDTWFRKLASRLNNAIRYRITHIRMTDQGCMLRAYSRHVVDAMVKSNEASTFIPALGYSLASNPTEIPVEHEARFAGTSKYRLYDLLRLNFDLMTGFSLVPLQLFTVAGIGVSLASAIFVVFLFIRRFIVGPEAEGVFTLFAILFFLIGIVLMGLGIVGEYIGRIYQAVRQRPKFIIKEIVESSQHE